MAARSAAKAAPISLFILSHYTASLCAVEHIALLEPSGSAWRRRRRFSVPRSSWIVLAMRPYSVLRHVHHRTDGQIITAHSLVVPLVDGEPLESKRTIK